MGLTAYLERKCPRCRNVILGKKLVEGCDVEIDHCPECDGMWFDGGELESLLGDLAADFREMPLGPPMYTVLCPVCREPMINGNYPGTYVKIDYCRDCGGLWLDRDEFQEIFTVRDSKDQNPALGEASIPRPHLLERLRMTLKEMIDSILSFVNTRE